MATSGTPPPPGSLRWLARGLIAYGIVGLVASAIGIAALVWAVGRIGSLSGEAEAVAARVTATIDLTAAALSDAARTARSFGATLDQSAQAVSSAATTLTTVETELAAFEDQLRAVTIFGLSPLGQPADAVGRVKASLDGLDTRLSLAADDLRGNQGQLATSAESLTGLADSTTALRAQLASTIDPAAYADLKAAVVAVLVVWAAWALIPAIGAIGVGLMLRRELGRPAVATG